MVQHGNKSACLAWLRRVGAPLFLAVLFFLGLFATAGYGMPFDEKEEQAILNANMREYILRFCGAEALPDADTGDPEYRIATSVNRDHGIAAFYPLGFYMLRRDSLPTRQVILVWHYYIYCLCFLGVIALYALTKELLHSRRLGCAAALFLFLSPRMFAEMHYNNKDMVCLALVLIVLCFGVKWIRSSRPLFALLFGIASAFAANMRLVAAFAFGLVGLTYLCLLLCDARAGAEKALCRRRFRQGLLAIFVCGATYVLITPALWGDPVGYAKYLFTYTFHFARWDQQMLYAGELYQRSVNPLPRSYLPVMIAITTPVWLLLLTLVGQAAVILRAVRSRLRERDGLLLCMVSLMWLVPLLLAVALNTHVYNGWRQFYFLYGPMLVMAAAGVQALARVLAKRGRVPLRVGAGLLALCALWSGAGIAGNHPYEFAYVNAFAGCNAAERYELDYWHLAGGPLIRELFASLPEDAEVPLSYVTLHDQHAVFFARRELTEQQQSRLTVENRLEDAKYVLLNLTYLHTLPEDAPEEQYEEAPKGRSLNALQYLEEHCHIRSRAVSYGNELMYLYERNAE